MCYSSYITDVQEFYLSYLTTGQYDVARPDKAFFRTSVGKRKDFTLAIPTALIYAIGNVAGAIILSIALIVTLGSKDSVRDLRHHLYRSTVNIGTLPVSVVGILYPRIINEKFLNLWGDKVTVSQLKPGADVAHQQICLMRPGRTRMSIEYNRELLASSITCDRPS